MDGNVERGDKRRGMQELEVILRFLANRTYASVLVGDQRVVKWVKSTVFEARSARDVLSGLRSSTLSDHAEDAQDEAENEDRVGEEIWRVSVLDWEGMVEAYWVVGQTGEVIGHRSEDAYITGSLEEAESKGKGKTMGETSLVGLRDDWAALIVSSKTFTSQPPSHMKSNNELGNQQHPITTSPLLELIRTSNNDTHTHGISKHFLQRLATQEDKDDAKLKREVAERYVLANVAGNR